jgi:4-aminobutyrate aminotransferase/(S)-3-amino-2-methylpropionate transaminase
MKNQAPGSPDDMVILSFQQAFHGRLLGSLSTTASKAIHKVDIPAFNWPKAPFPKLKYPLDEHEEYNRRIEKEALEVADTIMGEGKVAGVIIEPVQSEGGDNHGRVLHKKEKHKLTCRPLASPEFFRQLQALCKKHDALFIVDEVQTGVGATGTFWAHEAWNLPTPPDIVTFSKKFQAAGFYMHPRLRPDQPYRLYNTWMGDPVRAMQAARIVQEIKNKNLLDNVKEVGQYLQDHLKKIPKVENVRGQGSFIAFDMDDRDAFLTEMRQRGVNMGGCGEKTVRLRPMLTFQRHHADILLNTMRKTIGC